MPDFIRLTTETGHRVIVVTSQIAAVIPPDIGRGDHMTTVFAGNAVFRVKETTDYVLTEMGVPKKRTVFEERDVPVHELTDVELVAGWKEWAERKNLLSTSQAVLFEAELKRRGILVG